MRGGTRLGYQAIASEGKRHRLFSFLRPGLSFLRGKPPAGVLLHTPWKNMMLEMPMKIGTSIQLKDYGWAEAR
jgi:hypothetical protein